MPVYLRKTPKHISPSHQTNLLFVAEGFFSSEKFLPILEIITNGVSLISIFFVVLFHCNIIFSSSIHRFLLRRRRPRLVVRRLRLCHLVVQGVIVICRGRLSTQLHGHRIRRRRLHDVVNIRLHRLVLRRGSRLGLLSSSRGKTAKQRVVVAATVVDCNGRDVGREDVTRRRGGCDGRILGREDVAGCDHDDDDDVC